MHEGEGFKELVDLSLIGVDHLCGALLHDKAPNVCPAAELGLHGVQRLLNSIEKAISAIGEPELGPPNHTVWLDLGAVSVHDLFDECRRPRHRKLS